MRRIIDIQKQLLPDLADLMKKRYTILQYIMLNGVVGRRTLAASLHMTERVLRNEVDMLKRQGLIDVSNTGMTITNAGEHLLQEMQPLIKDMFGLTDLEDEICAYFHLRQVVIVPGDSDQSDYVKKELGLAGSTMLRNYTAKDDVIAVTGGSTVAAVAEHLTTSHQLKGNWFVPARGGLGESVELQANTVASLMAKKTGGQYRLLHVPDHLSEDAYQSLIHEPNIMEVVSVIREAKIVIHGIGNAFVMAARRQVGKNTILELKREGALAEAFGYYFDRQGKVVHRIPTVGLRLEDLQHSRMVIAVAGGKSKGESIAAVMRFGYENVLVTDEAAAYEIRKTMES